MSLKFDKESNFITPLFRFTSLFEAKIRLGLNRFLKTIASHQATNEYFFTKLTYLESGDMLKVKMMKNEI